MSLRRSDALQPGCANPVYKWAEAKLSLPAEKAASVQTRALRTDKRQAAMLPFSNLAHSSPCTLGLCEIALLNHCGNTGGIGIFPHPAINECLFKAGVKRTFDLV